ncbi:MAG: ABC transporter permease [Bacillota bacterium]|nr:ABC transporter permease [Bacillota bacterium]
MRRFLLLLKLKLIDILNMRTLMIMVMLLPPLTGLIAGSANQANRQPDIRIAIIDADNSDASQTLSDSLSQNGWHIVLVSATEAEKLLLRQDIDGVLRIDPGYEASLTDLKSSTLSYTPAEGSLVTTLVREAISAVILPEYSRINLLIRLQDQYRAANLTVPPDLAARFEQSMARFAQTKARLDVTYIGKVDNRPTLTYVVNDYSMEVLFLSLFAVMGMIGITDHAMQRRLATTRNGLLSDYLVSLAALQLIGMVQIVLYTAAMQIAMQTALPASDILLLFVFVYLMLGIGQLLALIHKDLRVYLGLLLLTFSAIVGGCFFQLPENILRQLGQYVPHGWILSTLRGYPSLSPLIPIMLSTLMLALGYATRVHRIKQADQA